MAKNSITDYDNIAANNTDIQSVDIDEGCAPSGINNAIRELMADLADVNDGTVPLASPDINGGTIDGVTIGSTTAGAGTFTTGTFSGNLTVDTNTLFVDSANNRVGIGTSSPSYAIDTLSSGAIVAQFKRDASGGGSGGIRFGNNDKQFTLYGDNSNGLTIYDGSTERLRIDASGNVGIGTTSIAGKFNVGGGRSNFGANSEVYSIAVGYTQGRCNSGQTYYIGATDSATPNLVFSNAAGTERMRIDNSGNVGIGTSSPSSYEASANNLVVVDSDGVAGITIVGSSAGASAIHFADGASGSESYRGYIAYSHNGDYMRFASAATEHMRIDSSGNLLVGTTASEGPSQLSVVQTDTNQAAIACRHTLGAGEPFVRFINSINNAVIGTIVNSGNTGTAYNTSSDYRLKEDMQPITGAIERVNALNPVNFAWKVDGSRVDGFLAHEAQAVVPEAVTGTKDAMQDEKYEVTPAVLDEDGNVVTEAVMGTRSVPNYQGIDQSKLVPLLTAALQEAIAEIETLKTKVAALENV
jgi:hypothetical protein